DDGAAVAAHDITVQATQSIDRWDRSASADGGFFGGGSSPKQGDFHAKREINYDGDVVLLIRPNPVLVIDEIGRVIEAVGITVNGGQGVGADVSGAPISVDNIGNLNLAGSALFQANTPGAKDGQTAPDSKITGSMGTARVKTTYDAITIQNHSGEELRLNDIRPANPNATGQITLDAQKVTAEFDIADFAGPTDITVVNDQGTSDVVLNGLIDNPVGLTVIANPGGEIRDGASGVLRTNDAVLTGTEIGAAGNRLNVELVRSQGRPTGFTATSGGDVYLDMTGRLRVTDAKQAEFDTGTITGSGGDVDLLLQTALQETDPLGSVKGITFTTSQEAMPNSASYVNHFRPDAGPATKLDPAIYADTSKAAPVAATYDFGQLNASGNIVVVAAHPNVADTTVNVRANTDVLGSGYIHALTNGNIEFKETAGDFRIDTIRSNKGDVSLESVDGSIYEIAGVGDDGLTPWVIGNGISLRATQGAIGYISDFLEINSSQQATGLVNALAHDGVFLRETAGDMVLGGVASQYSNVML
ncbi:MAG TPA: hypothetical protein VKJ07_15070, partial [Mycobacteriales bacterium]|nr:hypothetical protein [Mycobacteriales bacterium]